MISKLVMLLTGIGISYLLDTKMGSSISSLELSLSMKSKSLKSSVLMMTCLKDRILISQ